MGGRTGRESHQEPAELAEKVSVLRDDTTLLLELWSRGDRTAGEKLLSRLYPELRRVSERQLRGSRAALNLQPSDLVQETFVKLIGQDNRDWKNRAHFFAIAARQVRRVLIDLARKQTALKRGKGETVQIPCDSVLSATSQLPVLELDMALNRLNEADPASARVVELRFFGGLTLDETAAALEIGRSTVARRWRFARAWLRDELS